MAYEKKLVYSLNELDVIAREIISFMPKAQAFTFSGSLGAGKTTVIKQCLRASGVSHNITSPTFNYVNIYENDRGQVFYHFDLYRIVSLDVFKSAGFDEFLYQPKSWSFIEWPDIIMPLLDHAVCHVVLNYHQDENKRVAAISYAI